eukprot:GILJ01012018.1.p1 GENE.GILJ01012018.1~~GILJ01012018.1.p1  ORF type:complete len:902 (+),score=110.19 GILJ01012018.1:123-2828(+)
MFGPWSSIERPAPSSDFFKEEDFKKNEADGIGPWSEMLAPLPAFVPKMHRRVKSDSLSSRRPASAASFVAPLNMESLRLSEQSDAEIKPRPYSSLSNARDILRARVRKSHPREAHTLRPASATVSLFDHDIISGLATVVESSPLRTSSALLSPRATSHIQHNLLPFAINVTGSALQQTAVYPKGSTQSNRVSASSSHDQLKMELMNWRKSLKQTIADSQMNGDFSRQEGSGIVRGKSLLKDPRLDTPSSPRSPRNRRIDSTSTEVIRRSKPENRNSTNATVITTGPPVATDGLYFPSSNVHLPLSSITSSAGVQVTSNDRGSLGSSLFTGEADPYSRVSRQSSFRRQSGLRLGSPDASPSKSPQNWKKSLCISVENESPVKKSRGNNDDNDGLSDPKDETSLQPSALSDEDADRMPVRAGRHTRRETIEARLTPHGSTILTADFGIGKHGLRRTRTTAQTQEEVVVTPQNATLSNELGALLTLSEERTHRAQRIASLEELKPLGILGRGAGGVVKRCFHIPSATMVALKVINVIKKEKVKMVLKEIKTLYECWSPYLLEFFGAFYNEGSISIALQYMDAGSLQDLMDRIGAFPEDVVRDVAWQATQGLAYLHATDKIHRDIKPSNMLVNRKGAVKISDFGIASEVAASACRKRATFVGTMTYMSPERLSGQPYSTASDIWSLGLSLLTCALGKFPLPVDGNYFGLLQAVQSNSIRLNLQKFSPEFTSFIDACLCQDPADRFTAEQLLAHPWILQGGCARLAEFLDQRWEGPSSLVSSNTAGLKMLQDICDSVQEFVNFRKSDDDEGVQFPIPLLNFANNKSSKEIDPSDLSVLLNLPTLQIHKLLSLAYRGVVYRGTANIYSPDFGTVQTVPSAIPTHMISHTRNSITPYMSPKRKSYVQR